MEDISSFFVFSNIEIGLLIALGILVIVSLVYYIAYYYQPLRSVKKLQKDPSTSVKKQDFPMVSVIIESENEAMRLAENLPFILEQDYPNFEVVVVNKGSTDESDDILQDLSVRYPNLYHTYILQSYDRSLSTRKLALMVGIKAAKGEVLLFTEAYSKPISKNWISLMVANLDNEKQIALGYSYYQDTGKPVNRIARFDNLLFSMQYLSASIKNKPFTGVYRNIAYNKSLFFDNKGFSSCLGLNSGEEVFIHRIMTDDNTVVVLDPDSFVETDIESYSLWRQIKKVYSVAKSNFDGYRAQIFSIEYFSRYLFYALSIYLMVYSVASKQWGLLGITLLLFLINFVTKLVLTNKLASYFKAGRFHFSFILVELLQPLYNIRFRSRQKKYRY